MASGDETIELEEATGIEPRADRLPRMPEPLPVRVVAIDDVKLAAVAGLERQMDEFYVGMLEFVRDAAQEERGAELVYRADNFAIHFQVLEVPAQREEYRFVKIEVRSLAEAERKLSEARLEYTRQRTILPWGQSLLLLDPAGNWVELVEYRAIR